MPTTDAFIIAAIVLAFIVFGVVLAWADYQTRHVRPSNRQGVAQLARAGARTTIQAKPARQEVNAAMH